MLMLKHCWRIQKSKRAFHPTSQVTQTRRAYNPSICAVLRKDEQITDMLGELPDIGTVFSGGPAPGGHNVIAGLSDAAKRANPENQIFGFPVCPYNIIGGKHTELSDALVEYYRNVGGFTMINTGRKKNNFARKMVPDALVIVGGDDSNTNAAYLVQEIFDDSIRVIGEQKTIDGDIQVRDAEFQCLRILIPIVEGR